MGVVGALIRRAAARGFPCAQRSVRQRRTAAAENCICGPRDFIGTRGGYTVESVLSSDGMGFGKR